MSIPSNICVYLYISVFKFVPFHISRLFLTPCSKCGGTFNKTDFVMRAENNIYHIDCFRCTACSRQLRPGDEFALREGGLFCREDSEVLDRNSLIDSEDGSMMIHHNNNNNHMKLQDKQRNSLQGKHQHQHNHSPVLPTVLPSYLSIH